MAEVTIGNKTYESETAAAGAIIGVIVVVLGAFGIALPAWAVTVATTLIGPSIIMFIMRWLTKRKEKQLVAAVVPPEAAKPTGSQSTTQSATTAKPMLPEGRE
ncbi:MAG: hypothetical protein WC449_05485 [Candidatus Paceibacterota bacterium]